MSDFFCSVFTELKSLGVKVPKMKKFKSSIPKQARPVSVSNKIFGINLIEQEKTVIEDYPLPKFIVTSTNYLKKFIEKEIGLFRKAGSVSRQRDLRIKLEKGESIDNSEPNDIASLLKQWLRELPEPLIPSYLQDLFVRSLNLQSEDNKVSALLLCCHLLPFDNFCTLKYLINFLAYVTEHSDKNKMGAHNLALIMAPNIFVMGTNTIDKSSNFVQQHTSVVELLINNACRIGLPCTLNHLSEAEALKCSPDFDSSVDVLDFSPSKSKKKRRSGPVQDLFTGIKKLVGQNSLSPSKHSHQDDNSDTRSALKRKADPELLPSMSPLKKKATASNVAQNETYNSTPNKITQSIFGTKEKTGKAHSRRKSFGLLRRKEKKRQKSLQANALDTVLTVSTPDTAQGKLVSTPLEPDENKENALFSQTSPLLSSIDLENLFSKSGFIKKSVSDCFLTIHTEKSQDKQLFSVSSSEGCLQTENNRFSPYNLRSNTIGRRGVKEGATELNNRVEPFFISSAEADKKTVEASFTPGILKSSPVTKRRSSTPKGINQSNNAYTSKVCSQRDSLEVPNIPIKRNISRPKIIDSSQDKDSSSVSATDKSMTNINVDKCDSKNGNDTVPTVTLTQSDDVSSSVSSIHNKEKVKRECSIKRQEAFIIKPRNSRKTSLNQLKRADSIKISRSRNSRVNPQNGMLNAENKSFQRSDFSSTDETILNVQKNENKKCLKRNTRNGSIVRGRPNTVKTGLPSDVCSRYNSDSSVSTKHQSLSSKNSVDNNVNHHEKNDHDLSIIFQIQNITLLSPKEISAKINESKSKLSNMYETMIPSDVSKENIFVDTTKENITCDLKKENDVTDLEKSNKDSTTKESKMASKRTPRERLCSNSDSKVQNMKKKTRFRERTNSFPKSSTKLRPRKAQKLRAVKSSSPRKSLENNVTASDKTEKENMCMEKPQNQENANALKTPENTESQQMWYDGRQFLGSVNSVQDDVYNKRESIVSILKNNPGHVRTKASLYETKSTSSTPMMCNSLTPGGRFYDSRYSNTQNTYSQKRSTSTRSKKSMKRNSPLPPPPKFVIPDSPPVISYPLKEVTNISNSEEMFASPYPPSFNKLNELNASTSEDIFFTPPSTKKSFKTSTANEKSSEKRKTKCTLKPKMKSYSGHTPFKLPVDKSKVIRSESSPLLLKVGNKASRNLHEAVPQNNALTKHHVSLQSNENGVSAPMYKTRSFISIEKLHPDQLQDEWNYEM